MKKLSIVLLTIIGMVINLSGCGIKTPSSSSTVNDSTSSSNSSSSVGISQSSFEGEYTIEVFDIDGEKLGTKQIGLSSYSSVYEALSTEFTVKASNSSTGHYISSINGSIVDQNYYVAIYENNVASSVGVDQLLADNNDVFTFKVECWNTIESGYGVLDNYDLLVDKTIYNYAKKIMKTSIGAANSYTSSIFWELMALNMMKKAGYDLDLFAAPNFTEEYKSSLNNVDLSSLDGVNWGKYYVSTRLLDINLEEFKTAYINWVSNNMSSTMNAFATPFYLIPAKGLEIDSSKINTICTSPISDDLTWGPDGSVWQLCSQALFKNYEVDELDRFVTKLNWDNGASTALVLQAFAALNTNIRDSKYEINGKDLLETLFDVYYDEELNLVKYNPSDTQINMSTNQIYASLMAYKVCRDFKKVANIFA